MILRYLIGFLLLLTAFLQAEKTTEPVFTTDWFSGNIERWNQYKDEFYDKPNQYCLEIGSWEGRASLYIAENFCNGEGSHLICIDTWQGSREHPDDSTNGLYERFHSNAQCFIDNNKIIPRKGTSKEVLLDLNNKLQAGALQKFNFIYIDGSHDAKDVLMDAVLSWELLSVGGIMIFDDYEWGDYGDCGPKPAIDGFLASYKSMYEVLSKSYQVHIRKIREMPK